MATAAKRLVPGPVAAPARAVRGRARSVGRALTRRRGLRRLAGDPHPTAAAVARALGRWGASAASGPERAWFERIEALRADLAASDEVVATPYSAWTGDPDDTTEVRRPVAKLALEGSKPARWGALLTLLVRELRPVRCLELGTCAGISAAYQAAGLELNGRGSLVTVDADRGRSELSRRNLERLGLERVELRVGRFHELLDDLFDEGEPDLAFIDGHHEQHATVHYFDRICARLRRPGVVLLDDIAWSHGMRAAWRTVGARPGVVHAIDLGAVGLCILDAGGPTRRIRIPM